ncbi:heme ABC transporter ATP-binding protein (plasmid) [Deinococcus taeanensis]|uniref:heme ABC transporter ATP-binding protein n=1 Tax=Deinococcus taeanensis TaxID=2737050 RepID=UPI001CDB917D|nr:heme ABC transporter ATP-binding protein [Deinococcus taeanensis]UBV45053.1 heme ABC transporter ATP-binding protein [Deinococcus taeanensis]
MSGPPPVSVEALTVTAGGRALLRAVTLHLRRGELLAVLGPNGAGKSTLLRAVTGELAAQGVQVLGGAPRRAALARRRAVVAQHTPLTFSHEVLDVVLLGRFPHGPRETHADRVIARDALARVGLSGYEARDILTLSGGEQQRVHLARALAQLHGPDTADRVLLLDEPTASLDLAQAHGALRVARSLLPGGVGVLTVLHDLNLAAQYADRALLLAQGRVLACGTPGEALTPDTIRAAYGHEVLVTSHPCLACPLIVSAQ